MSLLSESILAIFNPDDQPANLKFSTELAESSALTKTICKISEIDISAAKRGTSFFR